MKKLAFSTALFALLFSAALMAEGGKMEGCPGMNGQMGGKMMGPKMILAMASELNLSADQMEKLKKLIDTKSEECPMKEEMKKDKDAMHAEMQKDTPDQAKIDAMIDKMAEKHKAAVKERMKNKAAIDSILTKEQKDILKKKMEEKKGDFKDKKNNCKGK